MKKTLLTTTMMSAIVSLMMSGQVAAHHPSEDVNPNFDIVDENISDSHNEVIDARLEDAEDDDMMASTSRGMDASGSQTRSADSGAANTDHTSSLAETSTGNGGNASRGGNSRR